MKSVAYTVVAAASAVVLLQGCITKLGVTREETKPVLTMDERDRAIRESNAARYQAEFNKLLAADKALMSSVMETCRTNTSLPTQRSQGPVPLCLAAQALNGSEWQAVCEGNRKLTIRLAATPSSVSGELDLLGTAVGADQATVRLIGTMKTSSGLMIVRSQWREIGSTEGGRVRFPEAWKDMAIGRNAAGDALMATIGKSGIAGTQWCEIEVPLPQRTALIQLPQLTKAQIPEPGPVGKAFFNVPMRGLWLDRVPLAPETSQLATIALARDLIEKSKRTFGEPMQELLRPALNLYLTAAAKGRNASLEQSIGQMYIDGHGTPKNETEGRRWLRLSAPELTAARTICNAQTARSVALQILPRGLSELEAEAIDVINTASAFDCRYTITVQKNAGLEFPSVQDESWMSREEREQAQQEFKIGTILALADALRPNPTVHTKLRATPVGAGKYSLTHEKIAKELAVISIPASK